MEVEFFYRLSKNPQISNFMKICQWEPSFSLRTDGHDEANVTLSNFANAPKNWSLGKPIRNAA
jgi:hypothetical protein